MPGEAEFADRRRTRLLAVAQTSCQVEHPVGGADDGDAGQLISRHERAEGGVVAQLPRAWLNRCTAGFQPPLTSSTSQASASRSAGLGARTDHCVGDALRAAGCR